LKERDLVLLAACQGASKETFEPSELGRVRLEKYSVVARAALKLWGAVQNIPLLPKVLLGLIVDVYARKRADLEEIFRTSCVEAIK
jgi:hypothetical protein